MAGALPAGFKSTIEHLVKDWASFEYALSSPPALSVRIHPKKFKATLPFDKVLWCKDGYYLNERPVFTYDPTFHGGAYYVQEAGSMLLWHTLSHLLGSKKDVKVLDLCAAPGGKSTLILSWLNGEGFLVANEVIGKRARVLEENIDKWGFSNRMITNSDPDKFEQLGELFDVVVVDAPCSGEGMFRKEEDALTMWSTDNVQHCHLRQNRILEQAMACLKPGGYLIYSTCTYNETENEGSLASVARKFDAESVDLCIPEEWKIVKSLRDGITGYRCFPNLVRSEGFFTGVLKKNESNNTLHSGVRKTAKSRKEDLKIKAIVAPWLQNADSSFFTEHREEVIFFPARYAEFALSITATLHVLSLGTNAGKVIRNELIPSHSLALSVDLNDQNQQVFEMKSEQALAYLKKDTFSVETKLQGLVLCNYLGVHCGWGKVIRGKMKNLYPVHLRIINSNPVIQSIF
jgi:16S rRNA C967 or C1407 C5-methylase (RsmB/RsmF family)/NOL1/NOP2/fmu family ribosome biogenesis protein